jgi:hypothetical protein
MKDLIAWYGFKREPFSKEIKVGDLLETEALSECLARLDFIKQRCGTMLLTGGSAEEARTAAGIQKQVQTP